MTDPERLARLEDREAIRDLLAHYAYRIADADVEGTLALFTRDCVVEILEQRFEGHEGLRALYADSLPVQPKPFIHNHLLESLEGDEARGRAVFEIRQIRDGKPETGGGCYEDHYRREDGRWKFHRRRFRVY